MRSLFGTGVVVASRPRGTVDELLGDPGHERFRPGGREARGRPHDVDASIGIEAPVGKDADQGAIDQFPGHYPLAGAKDADTRLGGFEQRRGVVRAQGSAGFDDLALHTVREFPVGKRGKAEKLQAVVPGKVCGRLGHAAPTDIARGRAQDALMIGEAPSDQATVAQYADPYRRIEPFIDQVDEALAIINLHLKRRVARQKIGKESRQPKPAHRGRECQPELTAKLSCPLDRFLLRFLDQRAGSP